MVRGDGRSRRLLGALPLRRQQRLGPLSGDQSVQDDGAQQVFRLIRFSIAPRWDRDPCEDGCTYTLEHAPASGAGCALLGGRASRPLCMYMKLMRVVVDIIELGSGLRMRANTWVEMLRCCYKQFCWRSTVSTVRREAERRNKNK